MNLYSGDINKIKQQLIKESQENNMELRYTKDIIMFLRENRGLLFKPCIVYFLYTEKYFTDKDKLLAFNNLLLKTKHKVVCIIDETLNKRTLFYKQYGNSIEYIGKINKGVVLQDKVNKFYKDYTTIVDLDTKEYVSFLYNIYYDFKNRRFRSEAGDCINLVLTGQVSTKDIIKVFILSLLDNNKIK